MIKSVCFCFKVFTRCTIISIIFISLLFGGYIFNAYKDYNLTKEITPIILPLIEKKINTKLHYTSIKDSWKGRNIIFEINGFYIKNENFELTADKIIFKIDSIRSLLTKDLAIKEVKTVNSKINILNSESNNNDNRNELIIKYINRLNEIDIELTNNNLYIKEELFINNISLFKKKNENILSINYEDKVKSKIYYKINKENIDTLINIEGNTFYISKIMESTGHKDFLSNIYFNNVYNIIGDINLNLDLDFNLKSNNIDDYKININLNGNKVLLNNFKNITLTNTIGDLYYDKKGFYSNKIKANLNKKQTELKIYQKNNENITFDFKTTATTKELSELINFDLTPILSGKENFEGKYELNFNEKDFLEIKSEFNDINYKGKINIKEENGFLLESYLDYEDNMSIFDIKQGKNNIIIMLKNNEIYNINVGFNQKLIRTNKEKGFFINGFLNNTDVIELIEDLRYLNKNYNFVKNENEQQNNTIINMTLKDSKIEDYLFNTINFLYQNYQLSLSFDEEDIKGDIYYNDLTNNTSIEIEKLNINTDKTEKIINKNYIETSIDENNFNLFEKEINIDFKIKELTINNSIPLELKTNGSYKNNILNLEKIEINDENKNLVFNAQYIYDGNKNISELLKTSKDKDILKISDLNKIYKSNIKAKDIIIDGYLQWNGFKINEIGHSLNGFININVGKGNIPNKSTGVGFAKIFNLFDFESLLKMFTFDFNDVKDGFNFNSIKGSAEIKNNIVKITPRIIIDSNIFLLEIKGNVDYIKSEYDLDLEAVVPLMGKTPIIALFTGVAPEVVGVIWLLDKIAGDTINDAFSRTSFKIKGSFNNPVFKKKDK